MLVLALLAWSPGPGAPKLPGVVSVDLVSMAAPAAAPAAAHGARTQSASPARARTEAPRPVPKPEPPKAPAPAPEPPRREAALPRPAPEPEPRKPRAKPEPKPEPKKPEPRKPEPKPEARLERAVAKPAPAREPARAAAPPAKPPAREEESYDDVLAELRAERGEVRPSRVASATPSPGVAGASGLAGASARGAGAPLDPGVAVWLRAAKFHVESAWIVPPGIQREALRTVVSVRLDASGRVLGAPRVTERSANPWYDESVVRAIQKASPLPPPPEAGEWRFEFTPPGRAG